MQMKHDLEAFSREIVSLIKTSGDSGGSGDKSKKSLPHNDFFVPTRQTVVSPVASEWGQQVSASGGRKDKHLQPVASGVPTVPTATTKIQQGPACGAEADSPPEWHAILAELSERNCPDWMTLSRWAEMLSDVDAFLDRWGNVSRRLGWSALDLFGVHPAAPASRFDAMGLFLLIGGGEVIALTASSATIRRRSGAVLTYRRSDRGEAVLMSKVRS
jgi:hypothetical protein